MEEKKARGGSRQGAGRTSNFGEKTKTITLRCPITKEDELKEHINSKLIEWYKPKK